MTLPWRNPNPRFEEQIALGQKKMASGSLGRVQSAAPVRRRTTSGRTNPYPGFNDTQRLYAEGDNYGSPFVISGPESDVTWIQNVDQAGDDITIDSTGPYADFGIRFNSTGLYSVYVRLEMDGDLVAGETGTRKVFFLKAEHVAQQISDSFHSASPSAWLPGETLNAVPFELTVYERTFLWWMEADEFTYVGVESHNETGVVTLPRSILLVRRIA